MNSPVHPHPVESSSIQLSVLRLFGERVVADRDLLAVEEPLEIRITYVRNGKRRQKPLSVTMRTPGADRELAAGFLLTEGVVQTHRDILATHPCRRGNLIRVHLRDTISIDPARLKRNFYTSSSCGVCGKSSIDAVRVCAAVQIGPALPVVAAKVIHQLPHRLREAQAVFEQTGGLHACALFDAAGNLTTIREDVGRHNALDKLIGQAFLTGHVPLSSSILLVSGRASFELVQKAAVAGIPIMVAVGAPSSLAAQLAQEQGITLIGFARQDRFNIYTRPERIREGQNEIQESPAAESLASPSLTSQNGKTQRT